MPPVLYAAFIAHRPIPAEGDPPPNYSIFDGKLFPGREYRQPLASDSDSDRKTFAPGLEIYLQNTDDIPWLYAWMNGQLAWVSATGQTPAQLTLVGDPQTAARLNELQQMEAPPLTAVYSNVDTTGVIDVFGDFIRARYDETKPGGKPKEEWHRTLTKVIVKDEQNTTKQSLKEYLDAQYAAYSPPPAPGDPKRDPEEPVRKLMRTFVGEELPDGLAIDALLVNAGDVIGVAAVYPSIDAPRNPGPDGLPLPDWIGAPTDAGRARRVTFEVSDGGAQPLNPLYSLYQLLGAPSSTAQSVTDNLKSDLPPALVQGFDLSHPFRDLYRKVFGAPSPPPALLKIGDTRPIPLVELAKSHTYPSDKPPPKNYKWHYDDNGLIIVDNEGAGPPPKITPDPEKNGKGGDVDKIAGFWNRPYVALDGENSTLGKAIGRCASGLEVPCATILGFIGAESGFDKLNERAIRLEPLIPEEGDLADLENAGLAAIGTLYTEVVDKGLPTWVPPQVKFNGSSTSGFDSQWVKGSLTWQNLKDLIGATNGRRVSPGLMQTIVSFIIGQSGGDRRNPDLGTVRWAIGANKVPFIDLLRTTLGINIPDPPPKDLSSYVPKNALEYVDWLLNAPQSILVGTAHIRRLYAGQAKLTRLDVPLIASIYNAGKVANDGGVPMFVPIRASGRWGAFAKNDHIDRVVRFYNAAIQFFDQKQPDPPPTVRFVKSP